MLCLSRRTTNERTNKMYDPRLDVVVALGNDDRTCNRRQFSKIKMVDNSALPNTNQNGILDSDHKPD